MRDREIERKGGGFVVASAKPLSFCTLHWRPFFSPDFFFLEIPFLLIIAIITIIIFIIIIIIIVSVLLKLFFDPLS